jgi:hypothetical protein
MCDEQKPYIYIEKDEKLRETVITRKKNSQSAMLSK